MNDSVRNTSAFPLRIPEETRLQLEKARSAWVRRKVALDMESWQRINPAPGYNDNPMAIDRYDDLYRNEANAREQYWYDRFDTEVLPEGLERFLEMLETK